MSSKKEKIKKQKVVKNLGVHTSPIPLPPGQQNKLSNRLVQTGTKKTFRWKIKETVYTDVDLKQGKEKLETELLFVKDVNIRDWNVLSV